MTVDDVLQEILLRLIDVVVKGGKPEKIIVSEKVYDLLMGIKLMPKSVQYIDSTFYIADVPVENGKLDDDNDAAIWFRIV
jgi:hypothetical protein